MKSLFIFILHIMLNLVVNAQETTIADIERDTIYKKYVEAQINSFVSLKHHLISFEKYDIDSLTQLMGDSLIHAIEKLDELYLEELFNFQNAYSLSMLRNKKIFLAYGYINTILEFEKCYFYPNIYAILMNEMRLVVNPKIPIESIVDGSLLIERIHAELSKLPLDDSKKIELLHKTFLEGLPKGYYSFGRGTITEDENSKYKEYELIDFLIILSRLN